MPTVAEILAQAGLDTYAINSLDPQVTGAFQRVLSEAEAQKTSVDEFWTNVYNPGVSQWEQDRQEMGRKIAAAEAKAAYLERERQALKESGLVGDDLPTFSGQPRSSGGQFMPTPGTPSFDPSDVVARASAGLAQIADADYRHRALFNAPMPITPSQLIKEADARGVDPLAYAEQRFGFSKRESEIQVQKQQENEDRIRADERQKIMGKYSDGATGSINPMAANNSMASIRRAAQTGERPDPLKLDQAGRRKAALEAIHRNLEERQQRDS